MKIIYGLISGFAGALTLTAVHEGLRRVLPDAPRVDVLGMRALAKLMRMSGQDYPIGTPLRRQALIGDLLANTLYYSTVAVAGRRRLQTWLVGSLLGIAAGAGAVALPGPLGLGETPTNRSRTTQLLTVLLYLQGGLVSTYVYRRLTEGQSSEADEA